MFHSSNSLIDLCMQMLLFSFQAFISINFSVKKGKVVLEEERKSGKSIFKSFTRFISFYLPLLSLNLSMKNTDKFDKLII